MSSSLKKSCANIISLAFKNIKSYPANFPQVYIIFFSIANGSSFYWIQENCLTSKRSSTSYWVKNAINVFINDWSDALLSLSDIYSHDSIKKAILSHSVQTKLFNWKIFVLLRMNNSLDLAIVKKNHVRISDHSESNIFIVYLISLLPIIFIKKPHFPYDNNKTNVTLQLSHSSILQIS